MKAALSAVLTLLLLGGCETADLANEANSMAGEITIAGETLPLYRNVTSQQTVIPGVDPGDLRLGRAGYVRLHVVVREDGTVESAHVRSMDFTAETRQRAAVAVRQWKFSRIQHDGRPIRYVASVHLHYRFRTHTEQMGAFGTPGGQRSQRSLSLEVR